VVEAKIACGVMRGVVDQNQVGALSAEVGGECAGSRDVPVAPDVGTDGEERRSAEQG